MESVGDTTAKGDEEQSEEGALQREQIKSFDANCVCQTSSFLLRILRLFPMQRWKRISDSFPSQILFPISARKCDIEGAQCLKNTKKKSHIWQF